ncbi:MAG: potassium-transporting ATPase subunit KdpC [Betaproteobacteria bacterium]|nr:potassium-transporting ATPase subunit KdpC [Betaproteobacteria bacterium]
MFTSLVKPSLRLIAVLSVITGLVYPAVVYVLAQAIYPNETHGSLLRVGSTVVGSRLIGQSFSSPANFWGRPSATTPMPDNPLASGGSNLGPMNPALMDAVRARIQALGAADKSATGPVPQDLVTASGSGLDPEISVAAAHFQAQRVAAARNMSIDDVNRLIAQYTTAPDWGLFGEARVNVLELNLALNKRARTSQ